MDLHGEYHKSVFSAASFDALFHEIHDKYHGLVHAQRKETVAVNCGNKES